MNEKKELRLAMDSKATPYPRLRVGKTLSVLNSSVYQALKLVQKLANSDK